MITDKPYKALTGYRALAIWMVFCVPFNPFQTGTFIHDFIACFSVGGCILFTITGFLIYDRYGAIDLSRFSYRDYIIKRFARFYPAYFLITTLTLVFNYKLAAFTTYWIKVYLLNITLIKPFFERYVGTLIGQGWPLTVIAIFYILAPVLFLYGRDTIMRYILIAFVIFGLGCSMSHISVNILHGFFWSEHRYMIIFTFFSHSFTLISGIIIGILHHRYQSVSSRYVTLAGIIGFLSSLLLLYYFNDVTAHSLMKMYTWRGLLVYNIITIPSLAALVWGGVREVTYLSRILSSRFFQILGASSYCFYLIHFGIVQALINRFITQNIPALFLLLIFASVLLWRYVQIPIERNIEKLSDNI